MGIRKKVQRGLGHFEKELSKYAAKNDKWKNVKFSQDIDLRDMREIFGKTHDELPILTVKIRGKMQDQYIF